MAYLTFAIEYNYGHPTGFAFDRATFQYQHLGSFIRNHRQLRVNVSYFEDFRGNL